MPIVLLKSALKKFLLSRRIVEVFHVMLIGIRSDLITKENYFNVYTCLSFKF